MGVFDKSALDLVSKKVSMYSGDIRRSLQITKRAVEICRDKDLLREDKSGRTKVNYTHVLDAFEEMFNSKTVKVLGSLKKAEVIVMLALWHELQIQQTERVLLDTVQDRCNVILKQYLAWQTKMQTASFLSIVKRLQAFGIVSLQIEHHKIVDNQHLQI